MSVSSIADALNFLFYFAEMSNYFSMKTQKRRVRKCLNSVKKIFAYIYAVDNISLQNIYMIGNF